jgi:alpha-L-fucosidase 2
MKRFPCSFAIALLLAAATTQAAPFLNDQIDWPTFLHRSDIVWNKLPAKWEEAAFTGNGLLGANIYTTDDGKYLKWVIGRSDVVYKEARMPIGDLVLRTTGTLTGGSMRLDLWNAEVTGDITTTAGKIHFRSLTHADQMVNIIQLTPDAGEKNCTWEFQPGPAADPRAIAQKTPIPEADQNPTPTTSTKDNVTTTTQALKSGGGYVTAWSTAPADNRPKTTYVSVGYSTTDLPAAENEAVAAVGKASASSLDDLTTSHQNYWHTYWPESFVSLPDNRLESFYQIQMYKLASATRKDREVIDLQGPWTRTTPWPRIWWNLNIQLTYWPIYTANRLELGEPFCKTLDDHHDQLAKNAKQFSADSYAIGRSTSYDLAKNTQPEIGNLTWALDNYYLQYRYSMDDAMLRDRLFPLLKGSINYYLHILKKGDDGKLHIPQGLSPEYPNQPSPDPDTNYDLGLLRWGCQTLLATCDRLKIDDPLIPQWKETLANLTPYPTDDTGLRISASVPDAESHRHYSHLLMIYPLHIMTPDQPENRDLIEKSLAHWTSMPKAFRGFSYGGASSLSSLLGRGDDALLWLNNWFTTDTKFKVTPNTMYVEAGPVMESPLAGAAAVNDMLLQSWGNKLRVFPAIPGAWQDVAFSHLRGEGAFLVSANRQAGKTVSIEIQSLAGEPCHVVTDMVDPQPRVLSEVRKLSRNEFEVDLTSIRKVADHEYEIGIKKGEIVLLTPGGAEALPIAPVSQSAPPNYWGVK